MIYLDVIGLKLHLSFDDINGLIDYISKFGVEIDFDFTELSEGEALIICSDGLSNLVSDEKMLEIFNENKLDNVCEKYIEEANRNGGYDNITVVVMKG